MNPKMRNISLVPAALLTLILALSGCYGGTGPGTAKSSTSARSAGGADPRFTEVRLTSQEQQQVCLKVARALQEELKPRKRHSGDSCDWRWDMGDKRIEADIEFVAVDGGGHYAKKYGQAASECILYSEPDDPEIRLHSSDLMRTGNGDFCARHLGGAGDRQVGGTFTLRRTRVNVAVYGWSGVYEAPLSDDELIPARDLIVSVARAEIEG